MMQGGAINHGCLRPCLLSSLALFLLAVSVSAQAQDFTTALMQSTFEIEGPSQAGAGTITTGTVFVLGRPVAGYPNETVYTLITAAHVLDEISGEVAILHLRTQKTDGTYQPLQQQLTIRRGQESLYLKHPTADIAVMYLPLPDGVIPHVISTELLTTDSELERIEIHPGDTLFCLGYPLSVEINTFSVLRSGILASYPITPAKTVKQYLYNFAVFPGNSGGPVYYIFENRRFGGAMINAGVQVGIVGLVSQSLSAQNQKLDVSLIIPAVFIREAIDLLPTLSHGK